MPGDDEREVDGKQNDQLQNASETIKNQTDRNKVSQRTNDYLVADSIIVDNG